MGHRTEIGSAQRLYAKGGSTSRQGSTALPMTMKPPAMWLGAPMPGAAVPAMAEGEINTTPSGRFGCTRNVDWRQGRVWLETERLSLY